MANVVAISRVPSQACQRGSVNCARRVGSKIVLAASKATAASASARRRTIQDYRRHHLATGCGLVQRPKAGLALLAPPAVRRVQDAPTAQPVCQGVARDYLLVAKVGGRLRPVGQLPDAPIKPPHVETDTLKG